MQKERESEREMTLSRTLRAKVAKLSCDFRLLRPTSFFAAAVPIPLAVFSNWYIIVW